MRYPAPLDPRLPALSEGFAAAVKALEASLAEVPVTLLPEAVAVIVGAVERVRTSAMLRGAELAVAEKEAQPGDENLTTKEAAQFLNQTRDWLGRHRREYASALVSRSGQRARYSRRLLEKCLVRHNRSHTRSD